MVSARRVGSTCAAAASRAGSMASDLRLCRSIFRRWPKAAAATCSSARRSHGSGFARGTRRTTEEVTLGCGTNAAGEISNRILVSARQFGEHGEPAIGLVVLMRDDAFGDLALEHQHHHVVPGRPGLDGEPVDQERGRDIVGQVGDDLGALAAEQFGGDRTSARRRTRSRRRPGYRCAIVSSGASARSSRSTAITRLAPSASSARVSPPGPGPTSITVDVFQRPGGARDPRGEVEVEQKILTERFACRQGVFANDVAQRRQVVDRAHARTSSPPSGRRAAAPRSGSTDWPCRCRRCRRRCRDRARCG